MISWSDKLLLSDRMKKDEIEDIKNDIESGKLTKNLYCITFASNPKNLFDIYNTKQFSTPYYQKQDIHILGLAKNKDKAYKLVSRMLVEVYEKTGDFKVREYFS